VSFTILFLLVPIGAIVAWWLSHQRLTAKPWLEVGAIGEVPDTGASSLPAARIRGGSAKDYKHKADAAASEDQTQSRVGIDATLLPAF
jgi:hypothetical protein